MLAKSAARRSAAQSWSRAAASGARRRDEVFHVGAEGEEDEEAVEAASWIMAQRRTAKMAGGCWSSEARQALRRWCRLGGVVVGDVVVLRLDEGEPAAQDARVELELLYEAPLVPAQSLHLFIS